MTPFRFAPGHLPLLVSMPHVGTEIPDGIVQRMTDAALARPDTDWHVDRLYDFLEALGAYRLSATQSRYVIDLNRAPDGAALYRGANNTELCPSSTFDEQPIYRGGQGVGEAEIAERRQLYWQPYHECLAAALDQIRARWGFALLFDAHSIRSMVPRFFSGRLPDINLGTADGASAASALAARLIECAGEAENYSSVLNGRFKGGYITRHYGRPADQTHAVQLELAQSTYMDEASPFAFRDDLAQTIRPHLRAIVEAMLDWARERYGGC